MDLATFQATGAFVLRQRITAMVNRYDVSVAQPDWSPGEQVAFAQQKRMALREQVTLYTDESRRDVLCSFKARQVMDVRAQYDVTAADGTTLGGFRKDFAKSLLVSTFQLEQVGSPVATGAERNLVVALLRRVSDIPLAVHFDFATAEGEPVLTCERKWGLRDTYRVSVLAPWLDRRLAVSMAIGLDALLAR
jgi:hypothetical protein